MPGGKGMPPPDPVQAIKWHLVSKAGGATDPLLDDFVQKQTPAVRDAAERDRRQAEAERVINEDPLVLALMAQYKTARIVPGSVKPQPGPAP